jgi:hypothetical protein
MRGFGSHLPASRYMRAPATRCRLLRLRSVRHHGRRTLSLKAATIKPSRPRFGLLRPRLNLLCPPHTRISISLLLPSKLQVFLRFCPLFPPALRAVTSTWLGPTPSYLLLMISRGDTFASHSQYGFQLPSKTQEVGVSFSHDLISTRSTWQLKSSMTFRSALGSQSMTE